MDNETATHQKHGDEERQYVQDGRQKGQNGAPRGSTLNAQMVQKLSTFLEVQFFTSMCYGLLWMLRRPKA
jgi:hypothetical protein